ncbi:Hypothetical_protein [Hexamita inflata]|uniref:Hypothetical_protein n=1 Tax=Hexamita inflata TaxID=28002 RepID=A0AA86TSU0_9EUKA|nr:Hypothetical protein HINF_LOCUS14986 [Hexamita inflata]
MQQQLLKAASETVSWKGALNLFWIMSFSISRVMNSSEVLTLEQAYPLNRRYPYPSSITQGETKRSSLIIDGSSSFSLQEMQFANRLFNTSTRLFVIKCEIIFCISSWSTPMIRFTMDQKNHVEPPSRTTFNTPILRSACKMLARR